MKTYCRLIVLVTTIILLAACQPQVAQQVVVTATPAEEEITAETPEEEEMMEASSLRMAIDDTENSLNPYTYRSGYPGWNMLLLQYDTLMQLDTDGIPQPWLAENIETSDDGLAITLDLRDDVTWHDGEPFTADDVKFTVEYYQEFKHGRWTRNTGGIESVETDGDHRVIFNMSAVSPGFELGTLADTPMIPQHIWEDVDDPDNHEFETNIGTGPYKMVEMVQDQFYVFEANEAYWAGKPQLDELVFVQFADTTGQLGGLRTNAVDMIVNPVGPEQIAILNGVDGIDVSQGPEFTTNMLNYDTERAPFNNKTVRQAMNLAIDRQDLVDTVYLGAASPGSPGWIHPASQLFNQDITIEHDPLRAAALLEDAGITDSDGDGIRELDGAPLSFEFLVVGSDALRLRTAELVSQMLKEIGIEAQVTAVETSTWEDAVWPGFDVSQGRNYEMSMWGWSSPIQANPIRMPTLLHSSADVGFLNLTGFNSEEADALAEALMVEADAEARANILTELQAIVADELPFILLLYPDGAYAYWSEVYSDWEFMTGQGVFHKLSFLPTESRP